MSASGLVEADVWMQTPGNSFQPSDFWQKVRCVPGAGHVRTVVWRWAYRVSHTRRAVLALIRDYSTVPVPVAYDRLPLPVTVPLTVNQDPRWAAAAAVDKTLFAFQSWTSCCLAQVAPRLPQATEAAGVPLRLWFLSATTVYVSVVSRLAVSGFTCDETLVPTCNVMKNMAVPSLPTSTLLTHSHTDDGERHRDWEVC